MSKINFKQEIFHFMEEHLGEFALKVHYEKDKRLFYCDFRNIIDSRSISFFAHSYSEIYFNLVFFEYGLTYRKS